MFHPRQGPQWGVDSTGERNRPEAVTKTIHFSARYVYTNSSSSWTHGIFTPHYVLGY